MAWKGATGRRARSQRGRCSSRARHEVLWPGAPKRPGRTGHGRRIARVLPYRGADGLQEQLDRLERILAAALGPNRERYLDNEGANAALPVSPDPVQGSAGAAG